MKKLNVLVACESSGVVRRAFRALGHKAYSCDMLPADDGSVFHYQQNVLTLLNGRPERFQDKEWIQPWDLMIAHPPCTYLCNSGVRWLWKNTREVAPGVFVHDENRARWKQMYEAHKFFYALWHCGIPRIAIENPIPHRYGKLPPYTQIIQPWQHGHGETKATCLWLKNLPKIVPTNVVPGRVGRIHKMPPGPLRWKKRSKTYEGIAKAFAEQWGSVV